MTTDVFTRLLKTHGFEVKTENDIICGFYNKKKVIEVPKDKSRVGKIDLSEVENNDTVNKTMLMLYDFLSTEVEERR